MALALLEWVDADDANVTFRLDTGTNTHYELKLGNAVRHDGADDWVDQVYFSTPTLQHEAGGLLFDSAAELQIPKGRFHGTAYAQLTSSKAGGRAQAHSDVIAIPEASIMQSVSRLRSPASLARPASLGAEPAFRPVRSIANRSSAVARAASIETLLGEIVKLAAPLVMNLLKGPPTAPANSGANGSVSAVPGGLPAEGLMQVLQSILGAFAAPVGGPPVLSKGTSRRARPARTGNRFVEGPAAHYTEPFIFGVDDVLIASLVGPVLQVLPQLLNAANQKRIELRKSDNALAGGILSDINKRLMLGKLLDAQNAAQAQGPAAPITPEQLKAVADLLAQLPTDGAAPALPAAAQPAVMAKSLSTEPDVPHQLSDRALIDFSFGPLLAWNGSSKPVFDRNHSLVLRPRFSVAEPTPKAPLAKAILTLVLHDSAHPEVRVEKRFNLRDLLSNTAIECKFEPPELSHLPPNCCVTLLAQLRWRHPRTGRETRALGASEIVFVDKTFLKERGGEVSAARELTDMTLYRAFWNKVWEAPVLDQARGQTGERKKLLWELNMHAKYVAMLSASHDSNAMMQTRVLAEADDPQSGTLGVRGRMKAGIELSLAELNKLIPLWNGAPALDPSKLQALSAGPFLEQAARECKASFKLKGRAGEAGMVWVVPIFKLFGLTLSNVTAADDSGQVTAASDELVQFPLPVAARLIGLKSAT